jgi:hypothetical protein
MNPGENDLTNFYATIRPGDSSRWMKGTFLVEVGEEWHDWNAGI